MPDFFTEYNADPANREPDIRTPRRQRPRRSRPKIEALLARVPALTPCASGGCPNAADLLGHCLSCDIADGYA